MGLVFTVPPSKNILGSAKLSTFPSSEVLPHLVCSSCEASIFQRIFAFLLFICGMKEGRVQVFSLGLSGEKAPFPRGLSYGVGIP